MNEVIKKMAELLRSGATMLQDTCPTCGSPLFRLNSKTFCVKCGTPTVSLPSGTSTSQSQFDSVEALIPQMTSTILDRLKTLEIEVNKTTDIKRMNQVAKLMLTFLKMLEALKSLGKS